MKKNRVLPSLPVFELDLMRVLSILGVVIIHTVYPVYSRPDFLGGVAWWLANVTNACARVGVPLFIMMSGYLLIPKQESATKVWWRLRSRLLIPLFAWFAIFVWWDGWWLSKLRTPFEVLQMVASGGMYHLYFLVILVGLYALIPVIRMVQASTSPKQFWVGTRWLMWLGVFLYLVQYLVLPSYSMFNFGTFWLPYLGYFLLGAQLRKPRVGTRELWWGYAAGLTLTVVLGYLNVWLRTIDVHVFWLGSGVSYFDEYLSMNVVLMSTCLFQLLVHASVRSYLRWAGERVRVIVHELAGTAFGVYLVHFLVINVYDFRFRYAIEFLNQNILVYLVKRTVLVVVTSFAMGLVLPRIPLVRRLVGMTK